jgi:hypothetical protein
MQYFLVEVSTTFNDTVLGDVMWMPVLNKTLLALPTPILMGWRMDTMYRRFFRFTCQTSYGAGCALHYQGIY